VLQDAFTAVVLGGIVLGVLAVGVVYWLVYRVIHGRWP
jgi:formate/nitrite transporter FocA (FNT family)